ncbi:MAG: helix-turn-helix transcriptional regulator [Rikenellaceae bacterium]
MRDRLKKLLEEYDLTSTKFATILGVQPSSITHLLGGRNNPSYDFIKRVLSKFNEINPDWLLMGRGSMFRSNLNPESVSTNDNVDKQVKEPVISVPAEPITEKLESQQEDKTINTKQIDHINSLTALNTDNNTIENILVFYSDSTFKQFKPRK